jgi:hypothetical protein
MNAVKRSLSASEKERHFLQAKVISDSLNNTIDWDATHKEL